MVEFGWKIGTDKICSKQLPSLSMLYSIGPFHCFSKNRKYVEVLPLARREKVDRKIFSLISWRKIKMFLMEGGLQIRDLKYQNLEMGVKLLWNLVDQKPS